MAELTAPPYWTNLWQKRLHSQNKIPQSYTPGYCLVVLTGLEPVKGQFCTTPELLKCLILGYFLFEGIHVLSYYINVSVYFSVYFSHMYKCTIYPIQKEKRREVVLTSFYLLTF